MRRLMEELNYGGHLSGQVTALADWAVSHASLDDTTAVGDLLRTLNWVGSTSQVAELVDRDPASHVRLGNPAAVARLLRSLRDAGPERRLQN